MSRSEARTIRIAFFTGAEDCFFEEKEIEFIWHMGISWQQRQKSSLSMHESILQQYPNKKVIEISTKSTSYELGRALSAFNLLLDGVPVENTFQAAKVFNDGGPYTDLFFTTPKIAKTDPRISVDRDHPHRKLISFQYNQQDYPIEPNSMFYDHIYIKALSENKRLSELICEYDVFTDIEFNQKIPYAITKGPFNCQARSIAIFVSLQRRGLLEKYLKDPFCFIDMIYAYNQPPCQGALDLMS